MTRAAPFFTLTRNFVKKHVFQRILQNKVENGPNLKSNQFLPMPMGICCQIVSQIRGPVIELSSGNQGGTCFWQNTQFRKNAYLKKNLQKKVEVGPDPKSNQFCPMPMGIYWQICSQIGPPVLELLPGNHFLTFRSLWPWPLTSKQGWGHYFCGWYQHTSKFKSDSNTITTVQKLY